MRVIRVGTSNDYAGPMPETQRAWKIAEQILAEHAGEPVETILKRAWPSAALPPLVERWMDEYQPDMVVLQVNWFWYGYESTPLRFERRFGKTGARLSSAGLKVGNTPWFADNRWTRLGTRALARAVPGATHFTVPEVAATMEAAMRKVLAHEGVVLLVRGSDDWVRLPMASKRRNRRDATRTAEMARALRTICDRLNVPYRQRAKLTVEDLKTEVNAAQWHNTPAGERLAGEFDGAAMVEAWQAAYPPDLAGRPSVGSNR
jgi:hypothetical protein